MSNFTDCDDACMGKDQRTAQRAYLFLGIGSEKMLHFCVIRKFSVREKFPDAIDAVFKRAVAVKICKVVLVCFARMFGSFEIPIVAVVLQDPFWIAAFHVANAAVVPFRGWFEKAIEFRVLAGAANDENKSGFRIFFGHRQRVVFGLNEAV